MPDLIANEFERIRAHAPMLAALDGALAKITAPAPSPGERAMSDNLHDRRRRIIRTDGTIELLEQPLHMTEYEALLKADCFDTVMLRHLGEPLMVMLVIDNAWETVAVESEGQWNGLPAKTTTLHPIAPRFPINELATELYLANCRAGTTHRIAGDVAVLPDEDFS